MNRTRRRPCTAAVFNSGSGLGGERTQFSDVLGPDQLAEGRFSR